MSDLSAENRDLLAVFAVISPIYLIAIALAVNRGAIVGREREPRHTFDTTRHDTGAGAETDTETEWRNLGAYGGFTTISARVAFHGASA